MSPASWASPSNPQSFLLFLLLQGVGARIWDYPRVPLLPSVLAMSSTTDISSKVGGLFKFNVVVLGRRQGRRWLALIKTLESVT